jgi:hypothetical protein
MRTAAQAAWADVLVFASVSLSILLLAAAATPVRVVRSLRLAWPVTANGGALAVGTALLVFAAVLELLSGQGR